MICSNWFRFELQPLENWRSCGLKAKSEFWDCSERIWSWELEERNDCRSDETWMISSRRTELDCARRERVVEDRDMMMAVITGRGVEWWWLCEGTACQKQVDYVIKTKGERKTLNGKWKTEVYNKNEMDWKRQEGSAICITQLSRDLTITPHNPETSLNVPSHSRLFKRDINPAASRTW